jgi:cation transport ATPase
MPGLLVRVRPKEKVPTDGAVVDARSSADQSMLAGDSLTVEDCRRPKTVAQNRSAQQLCSNSVH